MPPSNRLDGANSTVLLRKITIFTFPPACIMLILHGVLSQFAFPALCVIPHAASAVLGLFLLYRDRVASVGSPVQALSAKSIFFADTIIAGTFFVFLILTFVFIAKPYDRGLVVLGTYSSLFMMVNFAIHFYFSAAEALHIITARTSPFKSLVSEYAPLNSAFRDTPDYEDLEEGNSLAADSLPR